MIYKNGLPNCCYLVVHVVGITVNNNLLTMFLNGDSSSLIVLLIVVTLKMLLLLNTILPFALTCLQFIIVVGTIAACW